MTDTPKLADDIDVERTLTRSESIRSAVQTFSPLHEIVFVFVVCMSQFMTQAALGNTLAPLEIISDSFNITNPGLSSWLIAGYSLTVGTFILFFGRCGDIFGYRTLYIIGWVWFAIWSLVAGLSVYSNYILFVFARTLQGLGPAMLLPNGLALLGATYRPGKKKYMVFSLFGATAPNGAVAGAVIASLFSQLAWWPWTFWSMAIYCAVLAVMSALAIPSSMSVAKGMSLKELVFELDVIGATLGVTGLVLINIAWNQGPVVGWQEVYVYVLLIIGAIILALFFVWEIKYASEPLIPFQALDLDVCFILGCIAFGWASFGIWVYYLWRFLENIRGITPLLASAQFVPPTLSGLTASFTTGILMAKLRPGWIMFIAMMAFTLGNLFAAIAPVHQTYWALTFVSLVVTPWGMDMSFPAATVVLSNAVGRRHQGVAASLVTTVVNYSISLGLGFAGTVEVHVNNGGTTFHDTLKGYRSALYLGIGLGGLGVATSLLYLIKSRPRSGQKDDQIEKVSE
ncbi:MFS transporter [Aspergillus ibericus CBS 121593]|uniref:MFS general substrate transporter n=1 Tax=Aspergillus ibericus CBS 121593 TaxID=1448316 RepID=A0A395H7K2_9EURO|nr:MFS general substrate transporter [Aspergillus ibericus CBS 121593]RAL03892.1 MFS general substrate transporter [Aspergillus ibericus CBS 121593]